MKKFEIPEPKEYESFVNFYRDTMREGKESETEISGKTAPFEYAVVDAARIRRTDKVVS